MSTQPFTGFPKAGLKFFKDLAKNNHREWFEEHKKDFQTQLQQPAQAFVTAFGERLQAISKDIRYDTSLTGSGSIMRIYRDVRFSEDKTPYKTHMGIVFWEGEGKKMENPAFYFGFDATGGRMHAGMYGFDKGLLEAYRQAVLDDKLGKKLKTILAKLENLDGYDVSEPHYKRVPRGFDADHPRADLLLYNSLGASSPQISADTLTSPDLIDICFEYSQNMAPLQQWLVKIKISAKG